MNPYEIEDTSDWLGSPTELETCQQYLRMLENEVQELTLQLRKAREDVFGLVQMHADASNERDRLRMEVRRLTTELSDAMRKVGAIDTTTSAQLTAKDRVTSTPESSNSLESSSTPAFRATKLLDLQLP